MEVNKGEKTGTEMKALIIYWSGTGNTEKVAKAIQRGLDKEKVTTTLSKITEAEAEELYDYDLVFIGSPSYQFLPPKPVLKYVDSKMKHHRERGDIRLCAPKMPGKAAIVFCTYSGPHTGVNEAIPAGKYLGQFLEHIGFEVTAEWYIVGEFHGRNEFSTKGKLGDIRGRPNERDLSKVENDVCELVRKLKFPQT
jgi:hypothetical protein